MKSYGSAASLNLMQDADKRKGVATVAADLDQDMQSNLHCSPTLSTPHATALKTEKLANTTASNCLVTHLRKVIE